MDLATRALVSEHQFILTERAMKQPLHSMLSRREREIMDVLYQTGGTTAHGIRKALSATPSHSTVRTQLRALEHKGYIRREPQRIPQLFTPVVPRHLAGTQELDRLVRTFFSDSVHAVVWALLSAQTSRVAERELEEIGRMVVRLRQERRLSAAGIQNGD
jgi:predicted transcriptional regulator